MKRKELLSALLSVKSGVASKEIVESMTYIYFSGEEVISYNDVISISHPLKTDFKGSVKADDFLKVISKLKSDEIQFKMEGDTLKMKADKAMLSFSTILDEEIVKRIDTVKQTLKDAKVQKLHSDFLSSVKMCIQVASKNESDQLLTCIHVKGKDMVATDNIRIAHSVMKFPMEEFLIKASELKSLSDTSPNKYAATKAWIHFLNEDGCVFSIRRVNGEFPDMLKFAEFTGIEINLPKELLEGIDLAAVFTDDSNNSINISIKTGMCRIYKESVGGRIDFRENIDYKGQDINFNINPDLLKEMMSHSTFITIASYKAKLTNDNFTLVTSLYGG